MDYQGRLHRLHGAMVAAGLDAVIYGTGANCQYFSGLPVAWTREDEPAEPDCLLVVLREDVPRLIVPPALAAGLTGRVPAAVAVVPGETRQAVRGLLSRLLAGTRVGLGRKAGPYLAALVGEVDPSIECVEAEALGEALRVFKEAGEIAALRRAVALTDQVMAAVVSKIKPGVTQLDLQAMIKAEGLRLGAQDVSFPPAALFVKAGSDAGPDPFTYPKDKGLQPATSIAFDFGFVLDGYCSDFGRSFYAGPAPDHVAGAYRALHAAQTRMIESMKPGLNLNQFWGILAGEMDRQGYGDRIRARLKDGTLGHQIGVGLHEDPWIRPTVDFSLQPGMVMALEPKAWLPGEYYLRVEDIVVVTDDGAEALTKADRETFELPV